MEVESDYAYEIKKIMKGFFLTCRILNLNIWFCSNIMIIARFFVYAMDRASSHLIAGLHVGNGLTLLSYIVFSAVRTGGAIFHAFAYPNTYHSTLDYRVLFHLFLQVTISLILMQDGARSSIHRIADSDDCAFPFGAHDRRGCSYDHKNPSDKDSDQKCPWGHAS